MTKLNIFFFGTERIHIQDALWFYALPSIWGIITIALMITCKV